MAARKSRQNPRSHSPLVADDLEAVRAMSHSAPERRYSLADCDGKRVAVLLTVEGCIRVIQGQAVWVRDSDLGNVLRVAIDDDEPASMFIAEDKWQGIVTPDVEHGCDFAIKIATPR
jgi:hypothetical protein